MVEGCGSLAGSSRSHLSSGAHDCARNAARLLSLDDAATALEPRARKHSAGDARATTGFSSGTVAAANPLASASIAAAAAATTAAACSGVVRAGASGRDGAAASAGVGTGSAATAVVGSAAAAAAPAAGAAAVGAFSGGASAIVRVTRREPRQKMRR